MFSHENNGFLSRLICIIKLNIYGVSGVRLTLLVALRASHISPISQSDAQTLFITARKLELETVLA